MAKYLEDLSVKRLVETLSPVLIDPKKGGITISLSKRFLLFQLLKSITKTIEDEPYLNFIMVLKSYKVLGRFLNGTIHEMHRDRNKLYFKNFFLDRELYTHVKRDIEWVYARNKDVKLTITKRGLIIYDNYHKDKFNVLLFTLHSGTWMPKDIRKKQKISAAERFLEEDIDTNRIYGDLVLKKGGIWIDNKFSRFACDYNRPSEDAIYRNGSEEWLKELWAGELTKSQRKGLMTGYEEFYFTLGKLIDTYRFNIIFDGHSMKDIQKRPSFCFMTTHIPQFYMPIVYTMRKKLLSLGYSRVLFNNPFKEGGYCAKWLGERFPDVFIFSMEVNKKLYMSKDRRRTVERKMRKISADVLEIFDLKDVTEEN